jgi:PAP2 superfamily protein
MERAWPDNLVRQRPMSTLGTNACPLAEQADRRERQRHPHSEINMGGRNHSMYYTFVDTLQRRLLLGLFVADLCAVNRLGWRIKHMRRHGRLTWDSSLRHYLQARARQLQAPLRIISYGERVVPLIDLFVWLRLRRYQPGAARFFSSSVVGVMLLRRLSKAMVHRQRPSLAQRLDPGKSSSFPSGHSADSLALVLALATIARESQWLVPIRLLGLPIAFMIGLSRIARNRHYPSDVLAGWGLALVWVRQVRAVLRP